MKILDFLNKETIISELKSRYKKEVLKELCAPAASALKIDKDIIVEALIEREELGSTGYDNGIGLPHAKLKDIDSAILGFGLSKKGVNFESIDGQPTHIFFIILTPENSAGLHLKLLAKISKILKNELFREKILKADTKDKILSIIKDADKEYSD